MKYKNERNKTTGSQKTPGTRSVNPSKFTNERVRDFNGSGGEGGGRSR